MQTTLREDIRDARDVVASTRNTLEVVLSKPVDQVADDVNDAIDELKSLESSLEDLYTEAFSVIDEVESLESEIQILKDDIGEPDE